MAGAYALPHKCTIASDAVPQGDIHSGKVVALGFTARHTHFLCKYQEDGTCNGMQA